MASKKGTTRKKRPPPAGAGARAARRPDAYHHGDLRRALLDAARVELHKVGAQELSLRGVARRAGVTHTAAYHHFADKDEILRRVAQEGFEKLDASMVNAMAEAPAGADPFVRLKYCGVGYLRFAALDPQALRLMFDVEHQQEDEPLRQAGERAFTRLVECIVAVRSWSGFDGDPVPDAILVWSFVHGFAILSRDDNLDFCGVTNPLEFGTRLHDRLAALYPPPPSSSSPSSLSAPTPSSTKGGPR